ncbi:DUF4082 domain-containing protein [Cryobacterium arcticum]|uniref:DUF4082 domain-containing protein n=1 Tax=Cryobacterium arcticum TaxID=670052 RepID=A0A317ZJT0_9MICO|nr:DUF4082 domain-containing protein [Cryobacterium arcticum]PXA65723.1 hypothetical protein CTB96_19840 [Cryobacterium arcticum]
MKYHLSHTRPRSAITRAAFVAATALALVVGSATAPALALPVAAATASTTSTLWGTSAPKGAVVDSDRDSVELGTTFTAKSSGQVQGVRYWKTAENTGTHTGTLWTSGGTKLATATFTSESASGWQTVKFAKPVSVTAGKRYVASYHAPNGRYAATTNLTVPASSSSHLSVANGSGTYKYGASTAFPADSWKSSGYWVDVVFAPTATTAPPAAPAPAPSPAPTATPAPAPQPTSTPKPTPTTAPTPAPSPAGSFAGANNTGPAAAGFTPTQKYTGPMTITTDGTVIKNQVIPAGLRIEANDVTIQGNDIAGPTAISYDQAAIHVEGDRVKILDNNIRGLSATDWTKAPVSAAKLVGDSVSFERNNVSWIAGDGLSLYGADAKIVGNWIHDFVDRADVHYDALHYPVNSISSAGLIRDNTVELWVNGGMTASLSFPDEAGRIVVDHNVIAGGNYALMGGGGGITFTNNLFWTKFSDRVGVYGPYAHLGTIGVVNWSNNAYTADGKTKGANLAY